MGAVDRPYKISGEQPFQNVPYVHAGSCTFRFEFVSIKTLDCRIYTKGEAQSHEKSRNRDTSRHFQSYFHWLQKQDAVKATWNTTIARSVGAQRSAQIYSRNSSLSLLSSNIPSVSACWAFIIDCTWEKGKGKESFGNLLPCQQCPEVVLPLTD